jgi:putative monooxygenase
MNMQTVRPGIFRPDEIKAHERGGGARTIPLVNRASGTTSFINGITIFEPGAAIPLHKHNCEESVMLLEGKAIAEIDGERHVLKPQDTTFIPAGLPHRFINASSSEPMKVLWIYATVDATRTIVETGDTRTIDTEQGS